MLKNGKGDVGFVNLPIDDSDINLSNTVMQLHDTFVASDKFKELNGNTVDLKRLQDYPLLMLELSTATRQAIVSFAHSQGVHLHPEIELASLELMTSLAKSGIGIACIPREFVQHELNEEKSLFEIKTTPALPTRAIGLALPKNETLTFAVKEFIKTINASVGENG
jgi:DNA-binding transcriptional LysR family regulator